MAQSLTIRASWLMWLNKCSYPVAVVLYAHRADCVDSTSSTTTCVVSVHAPTRQLIMTEIGASHFHSSYQQTVHTDPHPGNLMVRRLHHQEKCNGMHDHKQQSSWFGWFKRPIKVS
jgi:hypothetical protein